MPVERRSGVVFRVNGQGAYADHIGNLQGAAQGIQKQPGPDPAALPIAMYGQARQDEKRYWITRHSFNNALGRVGMANFTRDNRVVPDHRLPAQADVGLRGVHLLRLQRMADKEAVKLGPATRERIDLMNPLQLLDAQWGRHDSASKTDGSRNSRSRRGGRRGGASRAATKASHC